MNDLTLWILSIGGGLIGIFAVLSVVMVMLFIFILLVDEGTGEFNRRQKNVFLMMFVMVCTWLIFSIDVCMVDAPVSWFRGLPAGESAVMKEEITKHDGQLTIHQFYDVQHKYRDWVKLNKKEHAEWDAMKDGGA